jgi:hypothetical protein
MTAACTAAADTQSTGRSITQAVPKSPENGLKNSQKIKISEDE